MASETNGNGNLRSVLMLAGVVISLGMSVITLVGRGFSSGDEVGRIEQHLSNNDTRIDALDKRMDRDEDRNEKALEEYRQVKDQASQTIQEEKAFIEELRAQLRGRVH